MSETTIRLNKFLAEAGVCSRREADRYIEKGMIEVDGKKAELGMLVREDQQVFFQGKEVKLKESRILIAFHKPKGIVCTTEKREKNNIIDYINYPERICYAGRLDKDSEGLILLTNSGELINKMMRGANAHEKEYVVKVNKRITSEFLKGMSASVPLEEINAVTRPCKVKKVDDYTFKIILTQGLNRQIRRMCEYFGYRVVALKRIRIMNIKLGDLRRGEYRDITSEEFAELERLLAGSKGKPKGENNVIRKNQRINRKTK